MVAEFEVQVEAGFPELEPPLLEPETLVLGERTGDVGQCLALPECQSPAEEFACLPCFTRRVFPLRL